MPSETITGILFPQKVATSDHEAIVEVLKRIAICCSEYLVEGGYLEKSEIELYQSEYLSRLKQGSGLVDFIVFLAESKVQNHLLTLELEVSTIQQILNERLSGSVYYWDFGPMPGKQSILYETLPEVMKICESLRCTATDAGDPGILHVASINPIAALVASAWITHEVTQNSVGEQPFVFTFMVGFPVWNILLQQHFPAK
jgi:hypothetical protein